MRLAFVDFIYDYDAARPDGAEPLGGTTSAICFLARELVKSGVSCTFFNRVKEKRQAHGIETLPLQALAETLPQNLFDAYIFCGRWIEEMLVFIRANTKVPLIAWAHESTFTPPMTPALDVFDGVVFVSEWQKRVNQPFCRPHWRQTVIRNAMNPAVSASFPPETSILPAKTAPPVLLFAGSFARGAFNIPPIIEKIRTRRSDFTVEMFCNKNPSRDAASDAAYIAWLRSQPNIAHIGMVGQAELARRMRGATFMLAPNSWPETSCITLIEGLASGLTVISTDRAALPETSSGFARQIPIEFPDEASRFDMPVNTDAFAEATLAAWQEYETNPAETEARLRRQVDYFRANYQWSQRVAAWTAFIEILAPSGKTA